MTSYVYFVQVDRDGPIKIGHASDVIRRINAMQSENPSPLYLRAITPGGLVDEQSLHIRLRRWLIRGEWFSPSADVHDVIQDALFDLTEEGQRDLAEFQALTMPHGSRRRGGLTPRSYAAHRRRKRAS